MRRPAVTALGGKVRVEPEFIPLAYGEPWLSFAQWLDEGIDHAVGHGGTMWCESFLRAAPQAFLYRPPAKAEVSSVLLGVLGPSEDRVAQPFPLAVTTELRESPDAPTASSLPVAAERFVAEAAELCRAARHVRRTSDIIAQAQELKPPDPAEHERAARDLAAWQEQDGVAGTLWPLLFRSGAAGAELCLQQLINAIERTDSDGDGPRAVRLPLGGGGAAAASFWLEVVRALQGRTPAAFWPAEGASGTVILPLDTVAAASFGDLWRRRDDDPAVLDLAALEPSLAPEGPPLDGSLAEVIADPQARIRTLVAALESKGRS